MKIYVACHDKELGQTTAGSLACAGHVIVSTWHTLEFNPTASHTEDDRALIAQRDVAEIEQADALVLIAGPDKYSGGKFVEAGIAIGDGKRVIVLGRRENMLLWLRRVEAVDSVPQLIRVLGNGKH